MQLIFHIYFIFHTCDMITDAGHRLLNPSFPFWRSCSSVLGKAEIVFGKAWTRERSWSESRAAPCVKSCVTSPPPHLPLTPLSSSALPPSFDLWKSPAFLPPSLRNPTPLLLLLHLNAPRVLGAVASFRPSHTSCIRLHAAKQTLLKRERSCSGGWKPTCFYSLACSSFSASYNMILMEAGSLRLTLVPLVSEPQHSRCYHISATSEVFIFINTRVLQ